MIILQMRKQCDLGLLQVSDYKRSNVISYLKAYGYNYFCLSEELLFSEDLDFKCPDNISEENSQKQHIGLEEMLSLNWESREG